MNIAPLMAISTEVRIVHAMASRLGGCSVEWLAQELETSERAIEEALWTLEAAGIAYDGGWTGWHLHADFKRQAVVNRAREVLLAGRCR